MQIKDLALFVFVEGFGGGLFLFLFVLRQDLTDLKLISHLPLPPEC